jgi:hypothetical protein
MITAPVLPTFDIQGMSNRWTRFTASDNVQPKALPETTRGQNSSVVGRARGIDRNATFGAGDDNPSAPSTRTTLALCLDWVCGRSRSAPYATDSRTSRRLIGRLVMVLRLLFTVHATLTVAAGIVLVIAPAAIPHAVGIIVTPPAFLLCYLLAAAELCIGLISWGARNLTDTHAIRLIATSFIVFHGASALLEIRAFMAGVSSGIWANVVVRFVAVAFFSYYGLVRPEGAAVNTSE